MTTEIAISVIALLISVLSAVYARWSAVQAKHANRVALHDRKLELFDAFNKFRHGLAMVGYDFPVDDLFVLLAASSKAKLYFTPNVVNELSRYGDAAYELLISRDGAKRLLSTDRAVPPEKWDEIFAKLDACTRLEKSLLDKLEEELQLVDV